MQTIRNSSMVVCALALCAVVKADVRYTITDLGAAQLSQPVGVNSSGHVVGTTSSGHLGLFANGATTDLGFPPSSAMVAPAGINDSDQITGTANYSAGNTNAFLYSAGAFRNLGALAVGGMSGANAINNGGQVVGHSDTSGGQTHPFLYSNGTLTDLGTLAGPFGIYADALGINDLGQVVGKSLSGTHSHAFLYSNGALTDLGTTGGFSNSGAIGISNSGDVIGWISNSASGQNANGFLYHDGVMTDLGSVVPNAINSSGQFVGGQFLWDGGQMTNLNTLIDPASGWQLDNATGISDGGYIIGSGLNPAGHQDYFLLTPIPEPQSVAIACVAVALLYRRRRRLAPGR